MIFRDASAALQTMHATPGRPYWNTKSPHLPRSQARNTKFGDNSCNDRSMTSGLKLTSQTNEHQQPLSETKTERHELHSVSFSQDDQQSSGAFTMSEANIVRSDSRPYPSCRLPSLPTHSSLGPLDQAAKAPEESPLEDEEKEPISSGFASPSALYCQPPNTPEEVQYPDLEHWHLFQSSSGEKAYPRLGSEKLKSNEAANTDSSAPRHHTEDMQSARIETWLSGVEKSPQNPMYSNTQAQRPQLGRFNAKNDTTAQLTFPTKCELQNGPFNAPQPPNRKIPSRTSSNKENVSPMKSSPSPVYSGILRLITTPSRFQNSNIQTATESVAALHFAHLPKPQGHLSLPPRRKKSRVSSEMKADRSRSRKDFTIHDDQLDDALAQLSPDVELRRKGRRPKRERCMSYWDEDILPLSSPCSLTETGSRSVSVKKGKRVLGESLQTAELTKQKSFTAEAESAAFDFHV